PAARHRPRAGPPGRDPRARGGRRDGRGPAGRAAAGAAVSERFCLRCDWSGDADGAACPECGAVLYRMSSAKPAEPPRRRVAAPPPREDVFVPVVEREPARPRPSFRRRIAAIAVAAIAATAIAAIELHTPSGSVAVQGSVPSGRGTLVYATKDAQG